MITLVCGGRDWSDRAAIYAPLLSIQRRPSTSRFRLIHGGARGADAIAASIVADWDWDIIEFRADWECYGKAAGPRRNQTMLKVGRPHLVLAFWDGKSRGTLDMISRATRAGVPVRIFPSTPTPGAMGREEPHG